MGWCGHSCCKNGNRRCYPYFFKRSVFQCISSEFLYCRFSYRVVRGCSDYSIKCFLLFCTCLKLKRIVLMQKASVWSWVCPPYRHNDQGGVLCTLCIRETAVICSQPAISDPLIKPHCISESDSMLAGYDSDYDEICDRITPWQRDWHPINGLIASLWCSRRRSVHRLKGVVLCYKFR